MVSHEPCHRLFKGPAGGAKDVLAEGPQGLSRATPSCPWLLGSLQAPYASGSKGFHPTRALWLREAPEGLGVAM